MPPEPSSARLLSIDLGSSNTVAVLQDDDGRVRPLLFDGSELLPSAVFVAADGSLHVGRDAVLLARDEPARFEPHPKRRINDGSVLLGDAEVPVVELLAAILRRVAAEARRVAGRLPSVLLSHPVAWGSGRRGVLADAARRAGLQVVGMVAEPIAAAAYFTDVLGSTLPVGGALAVFDFGGGTLDVAVVRRSGTGPQVVATGGLDSVGGVDLDAAIISELQRQVPAGDTWQRLAHPASPADLRDRTLLWQDVRQAKEMLSRAATATLHIPTRQAGAHLTRQEFERLAEPALREAVASTAHTVRQAGLRPDQLAGVFLVGGSSRIPLVAAMLHRTLGVAPTVLERPETAVAEGAGHTDAAPAISARVDQALDALHPAGSDPEPRPDTPRRRRWLVPLVAGVAALVVAGTAVAVLQPWRHDRHPTSAADESTHSADKPGHSSGSATPQGSRPQATQTTDVTACADVGKVNELAAGGAGDKSYTVGITGVPYCYKGWFYYTFNLQKDGQTMQSTAMVMRRTNGKLRVVLGAEAGMVCEAPPPDPDSQTDKDTWHAKEFWTQAPKRFIEHVC